VFGLVALLIRLMIAVFVMCIWLCWAVIALPMVAILSAAGHHRAARTWERSMLWRRRLF
jgi:hypothetical protein